MKITTLVLVVLCVGLGAGYFISGGGQSLLEGIRDNKMSSQILPRNQLGTTGSTSGMLPYISNSMREADVMRQCNRHVSNMMLDTRKSAEYRRCVTQSGVKLPRVFF